MKLKPHSLEFSIKQDRYRLTLKQYGFTLDKQEPMTVWEGGAFFSLMSIPPLTFRPCHPTPDVLKVALTIIKDLPKAERSKIAKRGIDAVIDVIHPGLTWDQKLMVRKVFGIL